MKRSSNLILLSTTILSLTFFAACGGGQDADAPMQDTTALSDTARTGGAMADTAAQTQEKINLNTASEEEFRTIPNVGDRMVGEFMEYRPYVSIRQFREEIGKYVDEEQVATYEEYVFVPIDPNESDELTLQQIPGLDASLASELVNGRPYASDQEFIDALSQQLSPEQVSTAERYLAD